MTLQGFEPRAEWRPMGSQTTSTAFHSVFEAQGLFELGLWMVWRRPDDVQQWALISSSGPPQRPSGGELVVNDG